MKWPLQFWAAALVAWMIVTSPASAQSRRTSVSIETIIEVGNVLQPVVINQYGDINIATVIEIGGSGTVDVGIGQTGTRNYANVFQVGDTTRAAIGQSGVVNVASVMQFGSSNSSWVAQRGILNTGTISQFGETYLASYPRTSMTTMMVRGVRR